MNLPNDVRADIESHYRDHEVTYGNIWGQLDEIHGKFNAQSGEGKITLLKLSYINSVISVQCPLHIHEEALNRLLAGKSLNEALSRVNYNGQKEKYLKETLRDDDIWQAILSDLESDGLDAAHKTAIDRLKFVGTVKVPFTFANLGFTGKMCLDANVCRLMGLEQPTTVVVSRYEEACDGVKGQFPTLTEELDAYELQWLLFDYQRFNRTGMSEEMKNRLNVDKQITYHDSWFTAALETSVDELDKIISAI